MAVKMISPQAVAILQNQGEPVDLIDVRSSAEFAMVHAQGARNVPLDQIEADSLTSQSKAYIICHSGSRAIKACEKLIAGGCDNVVCVEGGTQGWEAASLPVVRSSSCVKLPLERQLHIVLGLMVTLGVVLGVTVNPLWLILSGFVGCGMMFAGLTGICLMAQLIARMPWNQSCGSGGSCCSSSGDK